MNFLKKDAQRTFHYTPYRMEVEKPELAQRMRLHRSPGTTAKSGSAARWFVLILVALCLIYWLFPEVVSQLVVPEVIIEGGDIR